MPRQLVKRAAKLLHHTQKWQSKRYDLEAQRQLGQSVIKCQRVPLIITALNEVLDGNNRLAAVMPLNPDFEFDCVVVEGEVTEAEVIRIQLDTSMHERLTAVEFAERLNRLLQIHPGMTQVELAKMVSKSEGLVSQYLAFFKLSPENQQSARDGKLPMKQWGKAVAKQGKPEEPTERSSRVKCALGGGVSITVSAGNEGFDLETLIKQLSDLLKRAREAHNQGISIKSFEKVLLDTSKKARAS